MTYPILQGRKYAHEHQMRNYMNINEPSDIIKVKFLCKEKNQKANF